MKSIVIYATKYGTAEKAAKMLKEKLQGEVALVNIMKEKSPSFKEYDNVILGGSIYVGKIQKELTNYMKSNLSELMKKRVGLFICAALNEPEKLTQELNDAFPEELRSAAVAKEAFGYKFSFEKMNFFDKMATKAIVGIKSNVSELNAGAVESFAKAMNSQG
jgi:menaquinone-dependent protoporphyrinogen oxidase